MQHANLCLHRSRVQIHLHQSDVASQAQFYKYVYDGRRAIRYGRFIHFIYRKSEAQLENTRFHCHLVVINLCELTQTSVTWKLLQAGKDALTFRLSSR